MFFKNPYFTRAELACRCCGELFLADGLLENLIALRVDVGVPLPITSGYRCSKHNLKVGGARGSYHPKGMAVDIQATPRLAWLIASRASAYGFFGIGIKSGMIHLDRRSEKLRAMFGYS